MGNVGISRGIAPNPSINAVNNCFHLNIQHMNDLSRLKNKQIKWFVPYLLDYFPLAFISQCQYFGLPGKKIINNNKKSFNIFLLNFLMSEFKRKKNIFFPDYCARVTSFACVCVCMSQTTSNQIYGMSVIEIKFVNHINVQIK